MDLYHGTTQIIHEVDLTKGRHRTDFGQGFYLGSNLDVAQRWAKSRAAFSGKPIVMNYTLDNSIFSDEKANPLVFDEPTLEWLNFVRDNRRKGKPDNQLRHTHGIVRGSIANDKVNFVIEDMRSIIWMTLFCIKSCFRMVNGRSGSVYMNKVILLPKPLSDTIND